MTVWFTTRGAGLAAVVALIARDEWGYPMFADAPVRDVAGARRTPAVCPALSLKLEQL